MQMVRYIYPAENLQGKWIKITYSDNSKGWKSDGYLRFPTKDFYLPKLRKSNMLPILWKKNNILKHLLC
jgi:hypothetical protein